jgi:tRNA threonylcarbamoyladenosine biosynthesis protein TsaE
MNVFLPDERATEALATRLAAAMPPSTAGLTLLLRGDLGAGKSTFARALIRSLGHAGAVPSPTYTLVEPYDLPGGMVYHVDLYRVSSEDELRYLGWTELDEGFRIIEWPDRAPGITARADLCVEFEYEEPGRRVTVSALSPDGRRIVGRFERTRATEPVD